MTFQVTLVNRETSTVRKLSMHIHDEKKDRIYDVANKQMDVWGWNKHAREIKEIKKMGRGK